MRPSGPITKSALAWVQMSSVLPGAEVFSTAVYGTVFARRTEALHRLQSGDRLILVPDPPGAHPAMVWVHAPGGDVIGHLSPDVSSWLAPFMFAGRCYAAEVSVLRGDDVASWRRLVITAWRVRRPAVKSA